MSGDERAYFFYLLLLLIFIAGSVLFTRGERLSTTLRNALIWALIFAGVVIAYGFSDTLMSQLRPGRALSTGDRIEVMRARDGSFYLEVAVNGTAVSFLVDTGASQIVLSRRDAARVGLDPEALAYTGFAETANGTVRTAPVILETVSVAGLTANAVRATVNGADMEVSLLGMSYLNRFSELTIRSDRLILKP